MDQRLSIDGKWLDAPTRDQIRSPWPGEAVGSVPRDIGIG